jgi:hypothetical protein
MGFEATNLEIARKIEKEGQRERRELILGAIKNFAEVEAEKIKEENER